MGGSGQENPNTILAPSPNGFFKNNTNPPHPHQIWRQPVTLGSVLTSYPAGLVQIVIARSISLMVFSLSATCSMCLKLIDQFSFSLLQWLKLWPDVSARLSYVIATYNGSKISTCFQSNFSRPNVRYCPFNFLRPQNHIALLCTWQVAFSTFFARPSILPNHSEKGLQCNHINQVCKTWLGI